ncbi:hypothetical protein HYPSUDRAFT_798017 [Hypholoma sublateritium FD-334 SS-4]|uniref:Uncharacterized protein n=1 Tax=Hypholoma sublateritium (strain FD-334 SS-4) TaxID=945553 RepID=A0A0D2LK04_HYPSF|nr:hypothetical protein HYPSUDRAFT_798017 [Hypholoma sublateritium FD-334 SS-4]
MTLCGFIYIGSGEELVSSNLFRSDKRSERSRLVRKGQIIVRCLVHCPAGEPARHRFSLAALVSALGVQTGSSLLRKRLSITITPSYSAQRAWSIHHYSRRAPLCSSISSANRDFRNQHHHVGSLTRSQHVLSPHVLSMPTASIKSYFALILSATDVAECRGSIQLVLEALCRHGSAPVRFISSDIKTFTQQLLFNNLCTSSPERNFSATKCVSEIRQHAHNFVRLSMGATTTRE